MDEFAVFVFGMLVVIVLIFLAIGKWYPGSGAEQVDWKPTRSPEHEAELELEDVDQMIEAQNERRRARARRRSPRRTCEEQVARGRALAREQAEQVARVLIVGCGCRGRELGAALAQGHAVRGTSRPTGAPPSRVLARRGWWRTRAAGTLLPAAGRA